MKKIFALAIALCCQIGTALTAQEYYGYLYCHMAANSENTLYALGTKADRGEKFHPLLNNQPIFDAEEVARIEGGTRDAFICRGKKGDYLMCATDMCNRKSRIWNNYGIDLLHSNDLIHWTSVTFDFRKGSEIFSDPESPNVLADFSKINRVWAPQIIWDKDYKDGKGGWFVYYSMLSTNEGDRYDKIYYSYANDDFTTLTKPQLFYDKGIAVIDCHIDWNDYDNLYHVFYKKEGAPGVDRGVWAATFEKLPQSNWNDKFHITNEGKEQVEGPSAFKLIGENAWKVAYIRYSGGNAYKICNADANEANVDKGVVIQGDVLPQHGSFMQVTKDEYDLLEAWSALTLKQQATTDAKEKSRLEKILKKQYKKNAVKKLLKLYSKELRD